MKIQLHVIKLGENVRCKHGLLITLILTCCSLVNFRSKIQLLAGFEPLRFDKSTSGPNIVCFEALWLTRVPRELRSLVRRGTELGKDG